MDPESVRFMAREIHILRKLDHPNVIKLEGIVTSRMSGNLYLVFEYMEHDLAGLLARSGLRFTEPQVLSITTLTYVLERTSGNMYPLNIFISTVGKVLYEAAT